MIVGNMGKGVKIKKKLTSHMPKSMKHRTLSVRRLYPRTWLCPMRVGHRYYRQQHNTMVECTNPLRNQYHPRHNSHRRDKARSSLDDMSRLGQTDSPDLQRTWRFPADEHRYIHRLHRRWWWLRKTSPQIPARKRWRWKRQACCLGWEEFFVLGRNKVILYCISFVTIFIFMRQMMRCDVL